MSTQVGKWGEELVATELRRRKHTLIQLNWRTRWCEIDVITKRKKTVYFTEVKTRSNASYGSGFAYITPKKLQQMRFAAERWLHEQKWRGDARLCAAEVDADGSVEIIDLDF